MGKHTATGAKVGSRTVHNRAVHEHGARPLRHKEPAAAVAGAAATEPVAVAAAFAFNPEKPTGSTWTCIRIFTTSNGATATRETIPANVGVVAAEVPLSVPAAAPCALSKRRR